MLTDLQIEGFRCFESYRVEGLSRLSLLVGLNGVGKTTVLDAAQFAVQEPPELAAEQILLGRGETAGRDGARRLLDFGALVHGFPAGECRTVRVVDQSGSGAEMTLEDEAAGLHRVGFWRLVPSGRRNGRWNVPLRWWDPQEPQLLAVDEVVRIGLEGLWWSRPEAIWERVQLSPSEEIAMAILRVIRPDLLRIAWRPTEDRFVARLEGRADPVPAASLGEGFVRLLHLALGAVAASGGLLLIDEIDTGLHHSVLPDTWRVLHAAATGDDGQVIATTHSLDAVRSLARFVESRPEAASDVSLHRIHPGMDAPVRYSAEDLQVAIAHEMEVRG